MIPSAFIGGRSSLSLMRKTPLRYSWTKRPSLQTRLTRRSLHPLHAKRRADAPTPPPATPEAEVAEESVDNVLGEVATGEQQQQQQPQYPPQQQYYESYPVSPPQFPVQPPPPVVEATSGLPPWVWIMVGILLGTVFNKVMSFVSRPKEAMTEMMMQQMMNQMSAGSKGGPSPFGTQMPPTPPFGGMGTPTAKPPTAFDTTAMPSTPPSPPSTSFDPAGNQQTVTSDPQKNGMKTPEETKAEAPAFTSMPPPQSSFFQDVAANEKPKMDGTAASTMTEAESDEAVDFMFDMLKNPQMRDSLYQFLPENMRSPEMLETVMSSPMVKEQFKSMMTPELLQQIKGFRSQVSSPEMKNQMEAMNISPDVLMQKLMNEPEVVAMMQKPNVMQAVMDLQQNPTNMSKYVNDPEVMQFMMKMNELTMQAQMQSQPTPQTPTAPSTPSEATPEVMPSPTPPQEPTPQPTPAGSPSQTESSSS